MKLLAPLRHFAIIAILEVLSKLLLAIMMLLKLMGEMTGIDCYAGTEHELLLG